MNMSTLKEAVDDFLAQRRIAVAGVSRNPGEAANIDFGHKCIRWILKLSGGLPKVERCA